MASADADPDSYPSGGLRDSYVFDASSLGDGVGAGAQPQEMLALLDLPIPTLGAGESSQAIEAALSALHLAMNGDPSLAQRRDSSSAATLPAMSAAPDTPGARPVRPVIGSPDPHTQGPLARGGRTPVTGGRSRLSTGSATPSVAAEAAATPGRGPPARPLARTSLSRGGASASASSVSASASGSSADAAAGKRDLAAPRSRTPVRRAPGPSTPNPTPASPAVVPSDAPTQAPAALPAPAGTAASAAAGVGNASRPLSARQGRPSSRPRTSGEGASAGEAIGPASGAGRRPSFDLSKSRAPAWKMIEPTPAASPYPAAGARSPSPAPAGSAARPGEAALSGPGASWLVRGSTPQRRRGGGGGGADGAAGSPEPAAFDTKLPRLHGPVWETVGCRRTSALPKGDGPADQADEGMNGAGGVGVEGDRSPSPARGRSRSRSRSPARSLSGPAVEGAGQELSARLTQLPLRFASLTAAQFRAHLLQTALEEDVFNKTREAIKAAKKAERQHQRASADGEGPEGEEKVTDATGQGGGRRGRARSRTRTPSPDPNSSRDPAALPASASAAASFDPGRAAATAAASAAAGGLAGAAPAAAAASAAGAAVGSGSSRPLTRGRSASRGRGTAAGLLDPAASVSIAAAAASGAGGGASFVRAPLYPAPAAGVDSLDDFRSLPRETRAAEVQRKKAERESAWRDRWEADVEAKGERYEAMKAAEEERQRKLRERREAEALLSIEADRLKTTFALNEMAALQDLWKADWERRQAAAQGVRAQAAKETAAVLSGRGKRGLSLGSGAGVGSAGPGSSGRLSLGGRPAAVGGFVSSLAAALGGASTSPPPPPVPTGAGADDEASLRKPGAELASLDVGDVDGDVDSSFAGVAITVVPLQTPSNRTASGGIDHSGSLRDLRRAPSSSRATAAAAIAAAAGPAGPGTPGSTPAVGAAVPPSPSLGASPSPRALVPPTTPGSATSAHWTHMLPSRPPLALVSAATRSARERRASFGVGTGAGPSPTAAHAHARVHSSHGTASPRAAAHQAQPASPATAAAAAVAPAAGRASAAVVVSPSDVSQAAAAGAEGAHDEQQEW